MQPIGGYGVKDLDRNLFVVGKEAVSIQLGRESGLVSRLVILDLSAGTLSSPQGRNRHAVITSRQPASEVRAISQPAWWGARTRLTACAVGLKIPSLTVLWQRGLSWVDFCNEPLAQDTEILTHDPLRSTVQASAVIREVPRQDSAPESRKPPRVHSLHRSPGIWRLGPVGHNTCQAWQRRAHSRRRVCGARCRQYPRNGWERTATCPRRLKLHNKGAQISSPFVSRRQTPGLTLRGGRDDDRSATE